MILRGGLRPVRPWNRTTAPRLRSYAGAVESTLRAADSLPLRVQPVPLCPELRLELLDGERALAGRAEGALLDSPPYWAFAWASGQALARFLLDHPDRVAGRCALDFGSGSGLVALAAAAAGARRVLACDRDPAARAAILRNARLNGLDVEVVEDPDSRCEVLLAADVCYEPANLSWLSRRVRERTPLLIADPERRGAAPIAGLERIARFPCTTWPDLDDAAPGACVYRRVAVG